MPPKTDNNQTERSEDSVSREFIDPNNKKKWKDNKKIILEQWIEPMQYVLVTLQYLNDCLKEKEGTVGWWLILITSFTSFLTLFTPKELGTNTEFNVHYDWSKGVLLSVLSFTATLLASWAKKKGFVKRIKELDKRIYAIETKSSVVSSVLDLPIEDRPQYITFYKDNITEVQELLCYNQLISPTEMNEVLYQLTKNYPTLIKDIKPWYEKDEDGELIPNYEYGYNVIKSFEKRKLNGMIYRMMSCFYCKSKCCYEIDDGNPFTNKTIMSQIDKKNKDDASTRSSVVKKHRNSLKDPIPASNLLNILSEHNEGRGLSDVNSNSLFGEFLEKGSAKISSEISNKKNELNTTLNSKLSQAIQAKQELDSKANSAFTTINNTKDSIKSNIQDAQNTVNTQSNEVVLNIEEVLHSESENNSPTNQNKNSQESKDTDSSESDK